MIVEYIHDAKLPNLWEDQAGHVTQMDCKSNGE